MAKVPVSYKKTYASGSRKGETVPVREEVDEQVAYYMPLTHGYGWDEAEQATFSMSEFRVLGTWVKGNDGRRFYLPID